MSDMITDEAAGKLLEDDDGSIIAVDDDGDAYLLPSGLPNNLLALPACDDNGAVLNVLQWQNMVARFNAAPDLARTVIALHAQLAAAKAAQAMAVERAAEAADCGCKSDQSDCLFLSGDVTFCYREGLPDIRALADTDGLALVQALRAERDELKQKLISPDPYEDTAHFDDHSVNRFAAVMKGKLASKRLQGRGGWQEPQVPNGYLSRLLREHVDKGDPVDVANFAMMIHQRGERIAPENEGASCKAIDKAEADRDDALTRLAAIRGALLSLPAVYVHQINTGVREVYDPLQRFYRMEDVLRVLIPKGNADDRA